MARWEVISTLIVAAIAAVGGIIPVIINNYRIQDKPNVEFTLDTVVRNMTGYDGNLATLEVFNFGSAPATNFSVSLMSHTRILNVTNSFSTPPIFLQPNNVRLNNTESIVINNTLFELFTPKLIQGSGSSIKLSIIFEGNNYSFFNPIETVRTTYDQGSVGLTVEGKTGSLISQREGIFKTIITLFNTFSFQIYYIIIIIIYILIVLYINRVWRRKKFISNLINDLIEIRRKLASNFMTRELLTINFFNTHKISKYVRNVQDFTLIDDVYRKIKLRDKYITANEIEKLNQECFDSVNKALQIPWDKYD